MNLRVVLKLNWTVADTERTSAPQSASSHTHAISDTTGLQDELDSKASALDALEARVLFKSLTTPATNATTTLTPITGLDWTADANSEYLVEWNFGLYNAGSGNFKGKVTAPAGSSIFGNWVVTNQSDQRFETSGANLSQEELFGDIAPDESSGNFQKAYIKTGATAGTVSFQFAKATLGDPAVANEIEPGSWVRVEKVS
jgi:hypothetical protein